MQSRIVVAASTNYRRQRWVYVPFVVDQSSYNSSSTNLQFTKFCHSHYRPHPTYAHVLRKHVEAYGVHRCSWDVNYICKISLILITSIWFSMFVTQLTHLLTCGICMVRAPLIICDVLRLSMPYNNHHWCELIVF